jgi:hypothetical protein
MASQGPLNPSTEASIGAGEVPWTNLGFLDTPNAPTVDDSTAAQCGILDETDSDGLRATNYGFTIPTDATIDGIELVMFHWQGTELGHAAENTLRLVKAGSMVGTNNASGTEIQRDGSGPEEPPVEITLGSPTDLWGTSWTPAEINASTFGVQFHLFGGGGIEGAIVKVDKMAIKVYYTESGEPPPSSPARISQYPISGNRW